MIWVMLATSSHQLQLHMTIHTMLSPFRQGTRRLQLGCGAHTGSVGWVGWGGGGGDHFAL